MAFYYLYITCFFSYVWNKFLASYEAYEINPLEKMIYYFYGSVCYITSGDWQLIVTVIVFKGICYPLYFGIISLWCYSFFEMLHRCFDVPNIIKYFILMCIKRILSVIIFLSIIQRYLILFFLFTLAIIFIVSTLALIYYRINFIPMDPYVCHEC
uniref:Uncharacterized protein n=1 Tax=Phalansterium sp. PJK-2012 TaxID=1267188 RepID=T1QE29_9EUKA|nr:hypothetical protein [Phalansterium sp. PJK-2012]